MDDQCEPGIRVYSDEDFVESSDSDENEPLKLCDDTKYTDSCDGSE